MFMADCFKSFCSVEHGCYQIIVLRKDIREELTQISVILGYQNLLHALSFLLLNAVNLVLAIPKETEMGLGSRCNPTEVLEVLAEHDQPHGREDDLPDVILGEKPV